ncbi:PadR family transcriptional regulator [Gallaecimonas mangrovi]|uniref:PadR family transcriptional regulator n=1 Tax=Gallaecimonas mangrovi TaxID=2291597 RepID=UPI000E20C7F9|nr:PadR family transcriptional regulator [Gallaecimonas mangrovi]
MQRLFHRHGGRGRRHEASSLFDSMERGGGRRQRLFSADDIRILILSQLKEGPAHGYELIRAIGDLAGGEQSPSPGMVYPTLNLLEDMGHVAVVSQEGNRKAFGITDEGLHFLTANADLIEKARAKLSRAQDRRRARRVPELRLAMENFKNALFLRLGQGEPDAATVEKLVTILNDAASRMAKEL